MSNPRIVLAVALALGAGCGKSSSSKESSGPEGPGGPVGGISDAAPKLASADAAPVEAPLGLRLELSFTSGEHSKDTHAYRYHCLIENGQVAYSGPRGKCVRGQCERGQISFSITNAQERALLDQLEKLGLFASYEEQRDTSLTGHYESVTLQLSMGDERGSISVSGMTKAWGKDASQDLSDDGRRWVGKVDELRRAIVEVVKPHLPDVR